MVTDSLHFVKFKVSTKASFRPFCLGVSRLLEKESVIVFTFYLFIYFLFFIFFLCVCVCVCVCLCVCVYVCVCVLHRASTDVSGVKLGVL